MFDLEQAIADWRKQMLAAGIKTPVPLEELESHLREEIDRQTKSGLDPQPALEAAVRTIGHADALKKEFKKISVPIETRLAGLVGVAFVAVGLLFSLWILFVLFTAHEANWTERIAGLIAVAFIILSWQHGHRLLPVIRVPLVRVAIGFICCLGSVVWINLFIANVLPRMIIRLAGMEMPVGQFILGFLCPWVVMAILGSIGHGLEKAANRPEILAQR